MAWHSSLAGRMYGGVQMRNGVPKLELLVDPSVSTALSCGVDRIAVREALEEAGFSSRIICHLLRLVDEDFIPLGTLLEGAVLARDARRARVSYATLRGVVKSTARANASAKDRFMYKMQRLNRLGLGCHCANLARLNAVLITAASIRAVVYK
jgi:hypothetical protein